MCGQQDMVVVPLPHRMGLWTLVVVVATILTLPVTHSQCPSNFVLLNTQCVQQATTCNEPYKLQSGVCVIPNAPQCGSGQVFVNGVCSAILMAVVPLGVIPVYGSSIPCLNSSQNIVLPGPCPNQPVIPYPPLSPCPNQPVTPYPPVGSTPNQPEPCPNQPVTPYPPAGSTPNQPAPEPCPNQPVTPYPPAGSTPNQPIVPYPPVSPCPNQPVTPYPPAGSTPNQPIVPYPPLSPCPNQPVTPYPPVGSTPNQPAPEPCPIQPVTPFPPVGSNPIQPDTPPTPQPCPSQPVAPYPPCPSPPVTPYPPPEPTTPSDKEPVTPDQPVDSTPDPLPNQPVTPAPPEEPLESQPNQPETPSPPEEPLESQPNQPETPSPPEEPLESQPNQPVTPSPPEEPLESHPNEPETPNAPQETTPVPLPNQPVTPDEPDVPIPTTSTSTTTTTTTPPPAPLYRCPEGTVLINGLCRLVHCASGIYRDGRCLMPKCPTGTTWIGGKCKRPEPIYHDTIHLEKTFTEPPKTKPYLKIKNTYNKEVNISTVISEPEDSDYYDSGEDEISPSPSSPPPPPLVNKCCTVFGPRICDCLPNSDQWRCYSYSDKQCGFFCSAPKIYLKPPSVNSWSTPNLQTIIVPPDHDSDEELSTDPTNYYDCSGCATGNKSNCSSYCSNYRCSSHSCAFFDQQQYCNEYVGHVGCRPQDGWFK